MGCPFRRRPRCGRDPGGNILSPGISLNDTIFQKGTQKKLAKFKKKFLAGDNNFVLYLRSQKDSHLARTRQGRRACTIQLREKVLPRISTHVPETEGENQSKLLKQTRTKEFS